MKRKGIVFLLLLLLNNILLHTQSAATADSSYIIVLNQQVDDLVVKQDTITLDKIYASDFVFSHGSGKIEGKKGWFRSVAKGSFISRHHDSVTVELHPAMAIVRGKLAVQKRNAAKTDRYHLNYIRVYAYREKQWQLVSHITTAEFHEPS